MKGTNRGVNESLIALYRRKCLLVCTKEPYTHCWRGGEGADWVTSAPVVQFAYWLLGVHCPRNQAVPHPLVGARLINMLHFQGRLRCC